MAPRILVAVDGSQSALRAVGHVIDMLCVARETHITLLHVAGVAPELLEHAGGRDAAEETRLEKAVAKHRRVATAELEAYAEQEVFAGARSLIRARQNPDHPSTIETKLVTEAHPDPAITVIEHAKTGNYDAVVVGRTGRGKLAEMILGSVAKKVVNQLRGCPVWVID